MGKCLSFGVVGGNILKDRICDLPPVLHCLQKQNNQIYSIPGKAQKGHLAFEATFESANLGKVDFVQVLVFFYLGQVLASRGGLPLPLALPSEGGKPV